MSEILKNADTEKVWVTISRNVNLGNYQSHKLEAGISQNIKEGDDPFELLHDLEFELMEFVTERTDRKRVE